MEPRSVLGDGRNVIDRHCEALSLATGAYVSRDGLWMDYGDLTAFGFRRSGVSSGPWQPKTPTLSQVRLDQTTLEQAWNIHRLRNRDSNRRVAGMAILRWMRSVNPHIGITDQFIELRIALETLYLDSPQGELRFRLAIHGAWDLGSTPLCQHR